jgi:hypothetical protein
MWKEDEDDMGSEAPIPTRLAGHADGVSTDPLPTCWDEIAPKRKKTEAFV